MSAFTIIGETREEAIARWERMGWLDPDCESCRVWFYAISGKHPWAVNAPRHEASSLCESGKRPHCTCDRCW